MYDKYVYQDIVDGKEKRFYELALVMSKLELQLKLTCLIIS